MDVSSHGGTIHFTLVHANTRQYTSGRANPGTPCLRAIYSLNPDHFAILRSASVTASNN